MVYVRPRTGGKKGPKRFPGSRRKRCNLRVPPVKPIMRPKNHHPRKRKVEVLLWLIDNRVAVTQGNLWGEPLLGIALRKGQSRLTDEEHKTLKEFWRVNGVLYRPPTYKEAKSFWRINTGSIAHWWANRKKWLSPADYERSIKLPVWETAPGFGIPKSAPRPQVIPEASAAADAVDSADGDDGDDGDNSEDDDDNDNAAAELPPPTVMEGSDDSDIELDDDDDELPEPEATLSEELAAEARQAQAPIESAEEGSEFQDAPEYQEVEKEGENGDDTSDDDADAEGVEEADMYGTS
ncbi:hypothetical protein HD806DRAFT_533515 [Xylariaceae sp. AK1471]|nr:hypothetical protein HD806DRAFT_533515 [Xylariaceae sp. AK1471]